MPYASIDDNMTENQKVARLSDAAFRVYVASICYCSRNRTDGLVLRSEAGKVGATPRLIKELTDGRLWDLDPEGWRVHDYLEWNKSRAEIEALRAKQKRAADARWNASGIASGIADGTADAGADAMPSPFRSLPGNSPSNTDSTARAQRDSAGWYEFVTGREPRGKALQEQLLNLDLAHPGECIDWAWDRAIGKDDPPQYAKSILDRCVLAGEGHGPRVKESRNATTARADQRHPAAAGRRGAVQRPSDFD